MSVTWVNFYKKLYGTNSPLARSLKVDSGPPPHRHPFKAISPLPKGFIDFKMELPFWDVIPRTVGFMLLTTFPTDYHLPPTTQTPSLPMQKKKLTVSPTGSRAEILNFDSMFGGMEVDWQESNKTSHQTKQPWPFLQSPTSTPLLRPVAPAEQRTWRRSGNMWLHQQDVQNACIYTVFMELGNKTRSILKM